MGAGVLSQDSNPRRKRMKKGNPKIAAARLSILTAMVLAVMKFIAGATTGSLALLSSAVDSLLDIFMSGVNYLAIRQAEQPPDEKHPFGHGKFETIATLVQSTIIGASGIWIFYESVRRLIKGTELVRVDKGLAVLVVSAAASWCLAWYLRKTARETDSSALRADSLHYSMDVFTNLALLAGLAAIKLTGLTWLDPALSMLMAVYILFEAVRLVRHGMQDVLDTELPESTRREVARLIEEHREHLLGFHRLRTRRAGSQKIMDFHLTVCKHLSVQEAHDIADHLEKRIQQEIHGSDVIIHVEPCERSDCPGQAKCREERTRWHGDEAEN